MAALTTATVLAGVTAASAVAGTAISYVGQQKAASAQRKQERIRKRQADLEAARRRRQIIREAALNRAQTIAAVGAQGIGFGGSSLPGALSGQSNAAASNTLGVNQTQELGGQMFAANAQEAGGRGLQNIGGGISSLGGAAVSAFDTYRRFS